MDGVQLFQGYEATVKRQFTFFLVSPQQFQILSYFDQSCKDEGLSRLWSHPAGKTSFHIFKGFLMLKCIK